ERVFDGAPLVGIRAVRAERVVGLHHHHARPDPLEPDDPTLPRLAAIEPDVVRSESGREAGRIEHLGVELVDLHPERAGALVPVEGHVAVDLLEPRRAGLDGLDGPLLSALRPAGAPAAALREGTGRPDE